MQELSDLYIGRLPSGMLPGWCVEHPWLSLGIVVGVLFLCLLLGLVWAALKGWQTGVRPQEDPAKGEKSDGVHSSQ